MNPVDMVGRNFSIGDIVVFACNEVKAINSSYKTCGMQRGVVRGVSDNKKVLITMPSGFEGRTKRYDTYIRDENNAIVLSQFVIPEIEQFQELFDIRNDLL